jgi:hypothetical protein
MMMPIAPFESLRATESAIDGALTTGIATEPDVRTMTSSLASARTPRGSLFARVWRFAAGPAAHPEAPSRATC